MGFDGQRLQKSKLKSAKDGLIHAVHTDLSN